MSYKVDMSSSDIDKQIQLLKFYPEVMEKYFRPALVADVSKLYSKIKKTIPRGKTGRAISKFRKSVFGKGINIEGRVGWWGANQPWYINVVEYGAGAHPLKGGVGIHGYKKQRAIFETYYNDPNRIKMGGAGQHFQVNGKWVTKEIHPGFAKRGFMEAGFSALKPMVDADMAKASQDVLNEMAVK